MNLEDFKGYQMIICGQHIEIKVSEKVPKFKTKDSIRELRLKREKLKELNLLEPPKDRTLDNTIKANNKRRTTITRLINCNFKDNDTFHTMTFKASEITKDYDFCNNQFQTAIKRYTRFAHKNNILNFKYICVLEFTKKGTIHYHMITNVPLESFPGKTDFDQNKWFALNIWKNGHCKLNNIKGNDNIGIYITKYMTKDYDKRSQKQKHKYFNSRNLDKPQIFKSYSEDIYDEVDFLSGEVKTSVKDTCIEFIKNNIPVTKVGEYKCKDITQNFWGNFKHYKYNLNQNVEFRKKYNSKEGFNK